MRKYIYKIFSFISAGLFLYLFYNSFRYSYINEDFFEEALHLVNDKMLFNLFYVAIVLGCGLLFVHFSDKIKEKWFPYILLLVNILALLLGRYWLVNSHSAPYHDQSLIYEVAEQFSKGDYVSMTPYGGYVGKYPHQLGIITFIRILSAITGNIDFRDFQVFNLYMLPVLITSGYFVVKELTKGKKGARLFYLVAMLLCFPMYVYVPYVYGEISSTALVMACVWVLLGALRKFRWYKPIILGVLFALAIQLRKNALICLIAFLVVLVLYALLYKCQKAWILLAALIVFPLLTQKGIDKLYEPYEVQEEYGIPSTLHIAMGLNDVSEMGPGWYDDFGVRTYIYEAKADVALSKQLAKEHIKERLTYMWNHKAYTIGFFKSKVLSQWNDPLYSCLKMSSGGVSESQGLVYDVYFLNGREIVLPFSNIYQLVIYALVFVVCLVELISHNKEYDIAFYVLLIAVFGGFLFSIMWEAKSRYIFPYFIFMVPYAAIGLDKLYGVIKRR